VKRLGSHTLTFSRRAKWRSGGASGRRTPAASAIVLASIRAEALWSGHGSWAMSVRNAPPAPSVLKRQ